MDKTYRDAVSICKTIMRNGFEAYVINARLQRELIAETGEAELDIATDMDPEGLDKIFPELTLSENSRFLGKLSEGGVLYRFYPLEAEDSAYPEEYVARLTPRLLKRLGDKGELPPNIACPYTPGIKDRYAGFVDIEQGLVKFSGNADLTLKQDYLRGIRALRFSANYNLPIEHNTWIAIVRGARRILDYVSIADIMDEWRRVEAENMYEFVRLLFDCQILHGLLPEIAALSRVTQLVNRETDQEESVFEHTLKLMRFYPEQNPFDWKGTIACLFHDVGKLYTAEYFAGNWHFHQHHQVGAQVTRKILHRLRFTPEDTDLICHLVRHHMRFSSMLTDKGIRRFRALPEHLRLIELERANVKARNGNYTDFNHNLKMMERTEVPEEMLEPLLNGNEIMEFTNLNPGPAVGLIRDALLNAQVSGDVSSVPEAVEFVLGYKENTTKE